MLISRISPLIEIDFYPPLYFHVINQFVFSQVDCPEPVKLNVEKVEPEPLYLEITADGHVFPKTKKALCQRRRHKGPSELE